MDDFYAACGDDIEKYLLKSFEDIDYEYLDRWHYSDDNSYFCYKNIIKNNVKTTVYRCKVAQFMRGDTYHKSISKQRFPREVVLDYLFRFKNGIMEHPPDGEGFRKAINVVSSLIEEINKKER